MTRPAVDKHSRIYWSLVDDKKFATVYDNDAAFACWVRLLMTADMAWPSSGSLPAGTRRAALKVLVDVGLVDLQSGSRFRVHGLDAERERRSRVGKAGAEGRWNPSDEDAIALRPHADSAAIALRGGGGGGGGGEKEEEEEHAPPDATASDDDHLDAWYRLTATWPSAKVVPWLNQIADVHGSTALCQALAAEWTADPDKSSLIGRTQTRLEREAHAAAKAAEKHRQQEAEAERAAIEEMPPEQRAANMERLRLMAEKAGIPGFGGGLERGGKPVRIGAVLKGVRP